MLRIQQLPLQGSLCRTTARVVPTVRRRLHRIVRNSLWLSLTRYATPPFPQKSRSARLFGCKRPLDGSLSLPTFADLYIAFSRELHIILIINGGSKPPPYIIRYTIQFVRITDFCGFRAQEYFCTIVFNFTRIINFQQQKGEHSSPFSF